MREGRRLLVDELGLEPGPELRRLEAMILAPRPRARRRDGDRRARRAAPVPANATIGREGELAEIGALLARHDVRLLTLVGAGGVGKSRLALEAARAAERPLPGRGRLRRSRRVESVLVPAAAARSASSPTRRRARRARRPRHPRRQLADGPRRRSSASSATPPRSPQLLAGRAPPDRAGHEPAPLRLTAEHAYRVEPLAASNAAALFTVRVAAARPDWVPDDAVVEAICARLDGLPLAIELAADRARCSRCRRCWNGWSGGWSCLSGGPRDLPERQRSLRATLEWSWEVLEPTRSARCSRSSACSRAARRSRPATPSATPGEPAEALLAAIMDRTSLVVVEAGDDAQPRLAMLDSVREFAASHARGSRRFEARHAAYFLAYAERAATQAARADRRAWLARLARERGNLRVAFERLLRAGRGRGRAADRDRLRAHAAVGRARARGARLARAGAGGLRSGPSPRRAAALYWDGQLAIAQAVRRAEAPLEQALTVGAGPRRRRARGPRRWRRSAAVRC